MSVWNIFISLHMSLQSKIVDKTVFPQENGPFGCLLVKLWLSLLLHCTTTMQGKFLKLLICKSFILSLVITFP